MNKLLIKNRLCVLSVIDELTPILLLSLMYCQRSGPDHAATLFSVNALAACLSHQKKHTVSESRLDREKRMTDNE